MGKPIARVGDAIEHAGIVTGSITGTGSPTVQSPVLQVVAKHGDTVVCSTHPAVIPNVIKTTQAYTASVKTILGTVGVARSGDETTCGATVSFPPDGGNPTVLVGP